MGPHEAALLLAIEFGPVLILYTKPDCPLCDELKDELARLAVEYAERSITMDVHWYRRYRERIPVIVDDQGREHDPPFTTGRLRALLRL